MKVRVNFLLPTSVKYDFLKEKLSIQFKNESHRKVLIMRKYHV
jgi:hypothetical protein